MNKSTKRPAQYTDYRARSPKRRKPNSTDHQPHETPRADTHQAGNSKSDHSELTDAPESEEEDDFWPVKSIKQERGTGKRKRYLVEWEPHPKTRKTYPLDWVSREADALRDRRIVLTTDRCPLRLLTRSC